MMIKRNKKLLEGSISTKMLQSCIQTHSDEILRLNKLDNYYKGKHEILKRTRKELLAPNNKIVNNFAKYITDTACGYFIGNAVIYKDETKSQTLIEILEKLRANDVDTHDAELEKDLSVFGVGYELIYTDEHSTPKLALLDPRNAFVVYDDTVESLPLFGVVYYPEIDERGKTAGYVINVYTETKVLLYYVNGESLLGELILKEDDFHFFGGVPLIQYWNNEEGMGDFEHVLSGIDAYNLVQSDRVNDKQQFLDAFLFVANMDLTTEDAAKLRESGILLGHKDAVAEYITKSLNETETQVLADSLRDDIHKFSHTPDFTDENFSGNTSGVAMAYKLLSLENLAKVKERFFKAGIKERLKIFSNIYSALGKTPLEMEKITITMRRTLPINELEVAQVISLLKDSVSLETLLAKLPFVEDAETEAEMVRQQRQQEAESRVDIFSRGSYDHSQV